MLFNVHRHVLDRKGKMEDDEVSIFNLFPYKEDISELDFDYFFSLGFYPGDVSDFHFEDYIACIKSNIYPDRFLAIGEVGLDRRYDRYQEQLKVFEEILNIAEEYNKPIIIHCVKSYSELLYFRKKYYKTPWIIHGYRGNTKLMDQLISKNIFLSFGAYILKRAIDQTIMEVVKKVPYNMFFLETDEIEVDIKDIYSICADIRGVPRYFLEKDIESNFRRIFTL